MTLRVLIVLSFARLAMAQQQPDSADDVDKAAATTAERMDALTALVRRIGSQSFPEVVLHLFDPEVEMRARAVELLASMGDPQGLARGRLEDLAKGAGIDAAAARAAIATMYGGATPPGSVRPTDGPRDRAAESRYPSLEPALPGDAALLSPGEDRESIIPPFDSATTAGKFRMSMDLQVGSEVGELALRLGLHARFDVGIRLLVHPEDAKGLQIRFWHPVTRRIHVLVSATPYVSGLSSGSDYEYDEASGQYREVGRGGFGGVGATATLGARYARLVLSAELRGPSDVLHGVFIAGIELPLIRRMLNLKVAGAQVWSQERAAWGPLLGLDFVF